MLQGLVWCLVCMNFQVPEPFFLSWRRPHLQHLPASPPSSQVQQLQFQLTEATHSPMAVDLLDETLEKTTSKDMTKVTHQKLWLCQAVSNFTEFRKGTQFAAFVHGRLELFEFCTIYFSLFFHFPNMSKGYETSRIFHGLQCSALSFLLVFSSNEDSFAETLLRYDCNIRSEAVPQGTRHTVDMLISFYYYSNYVVDLNLLVIIGTDVRWSFWLPYYDVVCHAIRFLLPASELWIGW